MNSFFVLTVFILALLIFSTALLLFIYQKNKSAENKKNLVRLRSWWCIFAVIVVSLSAPPLGLICLSSFLTCTAYFEIIPSQVKKLQLKLFLPLFILLLVTQAFLFNWLSLHLLLVFTLSSLVLYRLSRKTAIGKVFLFAFFLFSLSLLPGLFTYGQKMEDPFHLATLVFLLLLLTSLNDVFQYISGKKFGSRPLAPKISPKKTLEGALGGILLSALLSSCLWPLMSEFSLSYSLLLGILIAFTGILGDLNISQFKRLRGQKESGSLLPGHGGILDRIDSLSFTLPAFSIFFIGIST
ncbi:MAG: phosphatidate cytidylyltransferase [Lentisphaeraceae bacterium]|nr:phosphatidate cytidylyltransferase [Lentisphaeraceae bacterium]